MNLTKLRNEQVQLIEYLKEGGYSDDYISVIKCEIKSLLQHGENYDSYLDYFENYIKKEYPSINAWKRKYYTLVTIMNFDVYNEYPTRNHYKHKLIDNSNYSNLNNNFKNIIDNYEKVANKKSYKENTIKSKKIAAASFLNYMQSKGYTDILDIKENDIFDYILDDKGEFKYSESYLKSTKQVLKANILYIEGIEKIIELFPIIHTPRKNIDYLTKEEINKIKNVINDDEANVSLRDKAIIILLLYTGLRQSDIVNLKLSDIDWENEKICITQVKTQEPLELPLQPIVGNALFNYITKERPKLDIENIFIRENANLPIKPCALNTITNKIFKLANIREGKRKGTHIFRYKIATMLLKNKVPQIIISQILGHKSPETLKHYLSVDFPHLKECSLDIEMFENNKEER